VALSFDPVGGRYFESCRRAPIQLQAAIGVALATDLDALRDIQSTVVDQAQSARGRGVGGDGRH
jgi:hypothetical protein